MLSALLDSPISESRNDIVSFTRRVSLAYLSADQQSYWYSRAALIHARASFVLPRGSASLASLVRWSEFRRNSRQFWAAVVRFRFPAEDSKMDRAMRFAVCRFSAETPIAAWIIWTGSGSGRT
ncbi:hypothetical protein TorRG33x02_219950 [Trema orientale]|uniref:Uncharacterized protein n=1 Tax=Trema orientale TaxID=63057 RepID=A0A2P5E9M5_TREOI|nr:hypothetical protein TorRG33x02_219950 [Trema orientale]